MKVPWMSITHAILGAASGGIIAKHINVDSSIETVILMVCASIVMITVAELMGFMVAIKILLRKVKIMKIP